MKTTQTNLPLVPKVARTAEEINELKKLSTEKLIIWIVGRSQEMGVKLTLEELVLECWLINPEKHALRGYPQFPDSRTVLKRAGEMRVESYGPASASIMSPAFRLPQRGGIEC
jgi:hypothetical protein